MTAIGITYIVEPDMGSGLKSAEQLVLDEWADAVKAARKRLDLSQVQAAERCRISQSTLSKIESADYPMFRPAMVLRLCMGLDMDPRESFGWPRSIVEIARIREGAAA